MGWTRGGAVAVAAVLALALAGCAKPPGVDGNLTNGWPDLAKREGFELPKEFRKK